ncbi:MAG: bifunctional riboflavin kinase/FAD synthetase [Woeseiaceae bacterium]|nr:bifunctional riboflavin kinase/FAD synthetase [Woeseiaceae bacterium]
MEVYRTLAALRDAHGTGSRGCVATIGSCDGIHLGHQAVIREVRERADRLDVASLVFSFEPSPREYFNQFDPPGRLTRFRERAALLQELGVDRFFCPPFNRKMQQLSVQEFIDEILVHGIRPKCLVVGDDFRFARGRAGTIDDLREAGDRHGFEIAQVDSVFVDGERVSSTAIRQALGKGDLESAAKMLGRPYSMTGRVKHGRHLGRELGFPTANIDPGRRNCAVTGVFAVHVHGVDDRPLPGVANVGIRPTIHGSGQVILEAHLFDFDRDIYGELITVEFVARIRDEMKFQGLDALIAQIGKDCAEARRILGS